MVDSMLTRSRFLGCVEHNGFAAADDFECRRLAVAQWSARYAHVGTLSLWRILDTAGA
jgi:hypothetical protein